MQQTTTTTEMEDATSCKRLSYLLALLLACWLVCGADSYLMESFLVVQVGVMMMLEIISATFGIVCVQTSSSTFVVIFAFSIHKSQMAEKEQEKEKENHAMLN